jgi:hypothetical protein
MTTFEIPTAFVVFNRPDHTQKSFEAIRAVRPSRFFIISDGPREGRPGEADLVRQSRDLVEQIDWPCDVTRLYADQNMGCGKRISSGVSAAMAKVDRLIVLEDDCVPDPSFFSFCQELLTRYENDQRVMSITGDNFQHGIVRSNASYYFSKYPHCWGWATWRRAWDKFDLQIPYWPEFRDSGQLLNFCHHLREVAYWTRMLDLVYAGELKSWAFPWMLACWMNHGLTAIPQRNLVANIGFGADATHTKQCNHQAGIAAESLTEIVHPEFVHRNFAADQYTDDKIFSGTDQRGRLKSIEQAIRKFRKSLWPR